MVEIKDFQSKFLNKGEFNKALTFEELQSFQRQLKKLISKAGGNHRFNLKAKR